MTCMVYLLQEMHQTFTYYRLVTYRNILPREKENVEDTSTTLNERTPDLSKGRQRHFNPVSFSVSCLTRPPRVGHRSKSP